MPTINDKAIYGLAPLSSDLSNILMFVSHDGLAGQMIRLITLCVIGLLLVCGSAAGGDASLDRGTLPGRLFFIAIDRVHSPLPGQPVSRKLYVMQASGETVPVAVSPDDPVVGLVSYPARHALGINPKDGRDWGSYLIDTRLPGYRKTLLIPQEAQRPFSAADWTDLGAPAPTPEQRHLPTQLVLAPDGTRVAGIMYPASKMCIVPVQGEAHPVCAESARACDIHFASWSPDGKAIVFAGAIKGDRSSCNLQELFVMEAAIGTARQLTDVPGDRIGSEMREAIVTKGDPTDRWHKSNHPAWSPDGQWIAFNAPKGISLIRPDGTGLHVIIKPLGLDPAWSPDGSLIAYRLLHADAQNTRRFPRRFDIPWVIHVARVDGSGDVQVSDDNGSLSELEVAWIN